MDARKDGTRRVAKEAKLTGFQQARDTTLKEAAAKDSTYTYRANTPGAASDEEYWIRATRLRPAEIAVSRRASSNGVAGSMAGAVAGGNMATNEELREWVYDYLRKEVKNREESPAAQAAQLSYLELHVKTKLQEAGEMQPGVHSHYTEVPVDYKDQIREIIWGLVIQGIVIPGASTSQADLPFFQVSPWGKKCLEAGEYLPLDAGQYLARLTEQIPGVDSGILLYLRESLFAFRSGAYLGSAVMTGVGAERSLLLLRDAVEVAISNSGSRTKFAEKTKGKPVKQTFDEIWKRLDPVHDALATSLHKEDVRAELSGTFDLIRKTRNEAGHPTGRRISREEAHNLLLLFPQYCIVAYQTMDWLKLNPLP